MTDNIKCEIALGGEHCGLSFFYTGTPSWNSNPGLQHDLADPQAECYHLHHLGGGVSYLSALLLKVAFCVYIKSQILLEALLEINSFLMGNK